MHHGRAVGFFTTVAGTCVLGSQLLVVGGAWRVARWLWLAGIVLWAVLTYTVFTALTVKADKPALAEGINGGWLVSVVAAQSVAVLGAQLAPGFGDNAPARAALLPRDVARRRDALHLDHLADLLSLHVLHAEPVGPGAAVLDQHGRRRDLDARRQRCSRSRRRTRRCSRDLLPFVKGLTLLFWATATWWIPMLRHPRRLAARLPPLPAALRPALLGRGLPAGHVHRLHVPPGAGDRRAVPDADSARVRLRRAGGVDADDDGAGARISPGAAAAVNHVESGFQPGSP